jgi:hypothetical protein
MVSVVGCGHCEVICVYYVCRSLTCTAHSSAMPAISSLCTVLYCTVFRNIDEIYISFYLVSFHYSTLHISCF